MAMEERVASLEREIMILKDKAIAGLDEFQVAEIVHKTLNDKVIEALSKFEHSTSTGSNKKGSNFKHLNVKDANHHMPSDFNGTDNKTTFRIFYHEVKVWASILHPKAKSWLEEAEATKNLDNDDDFTDGKEEAMKEFGVQLYLMLNSKCTGNPKDILMAAQAPNGCKAWNEIARGMDPRNNSNKVNALRNIQIPEKRAQSESEFMDLWKRWEHAVAEYELKFGTIDDGTKVVAINAMMPLEMQRGARLICHSTEIF